MAERRRRVGGLLRVNSPGVSARPARSRDELERAYRLVYHSYLGRGYVEESRSGLRILVHNALPGTVTFVSLLRDEVIATVSLVPDSAIGLPMDAVYRPEMDALRAAGRKLTEVTMLADRRHEARRALSVLLLMMKRVFDYATLVLKATDLCITVNPRHQEYYRRYLLFESMGGGVREYPSVENNPAVAERLDLMTVRERCRNDEVLYGHFFTDRTPMCILTNRYEMTEEDLKYFFTDLTGSFRDAPDDVIACLKHFYPDCPWDRWRGR